MPLQAPSQPSQTPGPKPSPRRSSRLVGVLLAVLLVASAGGGAWWWWAGRAAAATAATQGLDAQGGRTAKPVDPVFVGLEPFTVNLQPHGRSRYLHVAISLKVADVKVQALLVKHLPEVRSRVLGVLANRDADALLLPAEKERLANEVRAALEQPFGQHPAALGISQVMFTTFMLQ
jgi:flagellar FliL protein